MSDEIYGNLDAACASGKWAGDGVYGKACEREIERQTGVRRALFVNSCTAALEMMCLILDLKQDDEVIMPSFGFSSAANAVALRGAVPVFVDVRADTLNIDEAFVRAAITAKTKVVMVVHYAGVCAEMNTICDIASRYGLPVIEDAAQAYGSTYREAHAGAIGRMGAYSFHDTKNLRCGEGGALLLREKADIERAEIIREKGTDRAAFLRGDVDAYTWRGLGSSYVASEFQAAALLPQLHAVNEITAERLRLWNLYDNAMRPLEREGLLVRPGAPGSHNGHIYRILLSSGARRNEVLREMRGRGVAASFHFVPLHSSPAGKKYGRVAGDMSVTDDVSARLLRLPLRHDTTDAEVEKACETLKSILEG